MTTDNEHDITLLLQQAADEDRVAKERLYEVVYRELKGMAGRLVRRSSDREVSGTMLVHEVFLKFERGNAFRNMSNRRVFFSVSLTAMRQILIDHYRRTKNRGADGKSAQPLDEVVHAIEQSSGFEFEGLHDAMEQLELDSPRQHAIIMHRFFGGMTVKETADLMEISEGTVERDWRLARAKLQRQLRH